MSLQKKWWAPSYIETLLSFFCAKLTVTFRVYTVTSLRAPFCCTASAVKIHILSQTDCTEKHSGSCKLYNKMEHVGVTWILPIRTLIIQIGSIILISFLFFLFSPGEKHTSALFTMLRSETLGIQKIWAHGWAQDIRTMQWLQQPTPDI